VKTIQGIAELLELAMRRYVPPQANSNCPTPLYIPNNGRRKKADMDMENR